MCCSSNSQTARIFLFPIFVSFPDAISSELCGGKGRINKYTFVSLYAFASICRVCLFHFVTLDHYYLEYFLMANESLDVVVAAADRHDAIKVNLSCPNDHPHSKSSHTDPYMHEGIRKRIKRIKKTVWSLFKHYFPFVH